MLVGLSDNNQLPFKPILTQVARHRVGILGNSNWERGWLSRKLLFSRCPVADSASLKAKCRDRAAAEFQPSDSVCPLAPPETPPFLLQLHAHEEFFVGFRPSHAIDQQFHGLDRIHIIEDATQNPD